MDELRVYLLVRSDLGMPAGKLAVQAMHAVEGLTEVCHRQDPVRGEKYAATELRLKICLSAKSLQTLERAQQECAQSGIPCYLVEDAGRTVFEGPTKTVLAFGPTTKSELPTYLQRLQLMK